MAYGTAAIKHVLGKSVQTEGKGTHSGTKTVPLHCACEIANISIFFPEN